jgi:hypothetical protein
MCSLSATGARNTAGRARARVRACAVARARLLARQLGDGRQHAEAVAREQDHVGRVRVRERRDLRVPACVRCAPSSDGVARVIAVHA